MKLDEAEKYLRDHAQYFSGNGYEDHAHKMILIANAIDNNHGNTFATGFEACQALHNQIEEFEASDKVCVEDDGCPTETAVLKRFWREHQAKHIPFSIDRTHKNQAYVTLGFDTVEDCTNFIKTIS